MDHNINNNRIGVPRIQVPSSQPPPSPPFLSFIVALSIAMLIYTCIYVFSIAVSVAIALTIYIAMLLFRFIQDRDGLRTELGERSNFYAKTSQKNKSVVRILDKLYWVIEERGSKQGSVKKLIGSVVCFGSQTMELGIGDCAICLEDFKMGEECFVFPICDHVFHFDCINNWLEEKPNCPICRCCIPLVATMITKTRSMEVMENLV